MCRTSGLADGMMCRFQYGSIYHSPLPAPITCMVPLLQKWTDRRTERGAYGYPIEDPYTSGDKWYQRFENGTLAVDSRSRDLCSEIARRGIGIRNQGARGTCSVFAMTFLLEYAYTELLGDGYADLSEEYLNHVANVAAGKTDDGDIFGSVAAGYENFGVIREDDMPYHPDRVYDFNAVTITPLLYAEGLSLLQNGLRLQGHFVVPLGEPGATQEQFDTILSYLARGIPVAVGRSHSLAAVGYKYDPSWDGGGYLIFKNSYGPASDEDGYKRESFASVKSTVNDAYVYEQPYKVDWTPPEEIAAHWKLDDGSGTTVADSGNGAHAGGLQGGPAWTLGMRGERPGAQRQGRLRRFRRPAGPPRRVERLAASARGPKRTPVPPAGGGSSPTEPRVKARPCSSAPTAVPWSGGATPTISNAAVSGVRASGSTSA